MVVVVAGARAAAVGVDGDGAQQRPSVEVGLSEQPDVPIDEPLRERSQAAEVTAHELLDRVREAIGRGAVLRLELDVHDLGLVDGPTDLTG